MTCRDRGLPLCIHPLRAYSPRYGVLDWISCEVLPHRADPAPGELTLCLPGDIVDRFADWACAQDDLSEARFTFWGVDVQEQVIALMRQPFARMGARCGGRPPFAFWATRDGGPFLTAQRVGAGWRYEATADGSSRSSLLERDEAPTWGEVQDWMVATLTRRAGR